MKKIGGFFPLHLPPASQESVLALWGVLEQPHLLFANGRSGLHHLLKHHRPATLWLPAYSCTVLTEAVQHTATQIRYFPLDACLSPDVAFLQKQVKAGDAVLAIDYFGRNPGSEFIAFVEASPSIHWIEDRAQAMWPAVKPWGAHVLYSPRKLVGVPDGGIIVSREALAAPEQCDVAPLEGIIPALWRYEDAAEEHNAQWYRAYVEQERKANVSDAPMSRLSQALLAGMDARAIMVQRKANYAVLMEALEDIALWPGEAAEYVPFGFPVRLQEQKKIADILHAQGIFAAHHWSELPSAAAEFSAEHALAKQLLTLPCDQRYDAQDMRRIAQRVREALAS